MRLEQLALKGFLRFTDPVTIDLRDVPSGLIAITGENGAGKTTVLEAALAGLHRSFPSRDGELADYATGRDSFLDVAFSIEGRGAYHLRVNVDGVKRTTDAVVETIAPDGTRVALNDGKVSTFADVVRRELPSRELMLASSFSAQNKRGNVIGMKPAEGKKLFGELLGLAHLEAMSQTAKALAVSVDQARSRLAAVRDALAPQTDARLTEDLHRRANELQEQHAAADERQLTLRDTIGTLEARLATVADQVGAYAAASLRIATLERTVAERQGELGSTQRQRATAAADLTAEHARVTAKRDADLADLDTKIAGNQTILARATEIRAAALAIATIDGQLVDARAVLEQQQAHEAEARANVVAVDKTLGQVLDSKVRLATVQRDASLLDSVPCGGAGEFARCQFLVNARNAYDQIPQLEAIVQTEGALLVEIGELRAVQVAYGRSVLDTRARIKTLETDRFAHQAIAKYAEPLAAAEARIAALTDARQVTAHDAAQRLTDAQTRHDVRCAELEAQAVTLAATITRLTTELGTARDDLRHSTRGHAQAISLQGELATARADWDAVTTTLATVAAGRQELERRRTELAAARTRLADVVDRLARLTTEWLDWQLLTKALGRDGLQVLEIDAAGPAISTTANTLLAATFGSRFSLELVTQDAKADGKGMKESFAVQVFDNERGGDPRDVEDLSGGEQVIVSEALRNAIAIYVNARSPMPIRTCWRDETTGALDPANAQRYLLMLRKVHELGGFHHTIFVTHNAEIAAAADAQIRVADGTATIVYPPFSDERAA